MKVFIGVWVTKTHKLRARVTEEDGPVTEVTIGGDSWRHGKCKQYHKRILAKAHDLVDQLQMQLCKASIGESSNGQDSGL